MAGVVLKGGWLCHILPGSPPSASVISGITHAEEGRASPAAANPPLRAGRAQSGGWVPARPLTHSLLSRMQFVSSSLVSQLSVSPTGLLHPAHRNTMGSASEPSPSGSPALIDAGSSAGSSAAAILSFKQPARRLYRKQLRRRAALGERRNALVASPTAAAAALGPSRPHHFPARSASRWRAEKPLGNPPPSPRSDDFCSLPSDLRLLPYLIGPLKS